MALESFTDISDILSDISSKGHAAASNGKIFEDKTSNVKYLKNIGFFKKPISSRYYLKSIIETDDYYHKIIHLTQNAFVLYVKNKFQINSIRIPDEAYIIKHIPKSKDLDKSKESSNSTENYTIKIIEKKYQNVDGSVETKLWSGPTLKDEYAYVFGKKYNIQYAFTISDFLANKIKSISKPIDKTWTNAQFKYYYLKKILDKNNIPIFYGDDSDYLKQLNDWIFNFTNLS